MKGILWGFGAFEFLWAALPSTLTGSWLGLSSDASVIVDKLSLITAVLCLGIGSIIHEIQRSRK